MRPARQPVLLSGARQYFAAAFGFSAPVGVLADGKRRSEQLKGMYRIPFIGFKRQMPFWAALVFLAVAAFPRFRSIGKTQTCSYRHGPVSFGQPPVTSTHLPGTLALMRLSYMEEAATVGK